MPRFCASCANNNHGNMITDEYCSECYFTIDDLGVRTKPRYKPRPRIEDAQEDERSMLTKRYKKFNSLTEELDDYE